MATVTPNRPEERVAHPLHRLRQAIRTYVTLEGLAVTALYLALWFWIGLLLDYGFFKLFTIDWVQELPRPFRAGLLVLLLAGLAAVALLKVGVRLFREFRAPALALVLERRFPDLLGDRLITAVELADPRLADRYGMSQAMIDQTVSDAAERVEQLALPDVFDWSRLRRLGTAVLALTAGVFLLVGTGYCAFTGTANVGRFVNQFGDTAAIWFERNVLLFDTIWPRRAQLELVDFPGDEIRVGRDAPPPTLRVRALKWVVADHDRHRAPEGWRSLSWADLTPALLGAGLPAVSLPEGWAEGTVDQVELRLARPEAAGTLPAETAEAVRQVLERLRERAASPGMSRRLRELAVPTGVEVLYRGATTKSEQGLPPGANYEFAGTVANLRETLRFTVRGEDYNTPAKRIVVVPPPALVELAADEAQPAYLHFLPPADGSAEDLRGKRAVFKSRPVSLTGEKSTVQVPAGTDLVLTGRTDKPLKADGGVRLVPYKAGAPPIPLEVDRLDLQTFALRIPSVNTALDFVFEFTDTDQVTGRRHVEVRPAHDAAPEVDVQVEVIRKVNQAYLVTAKALVPFSGKVRDDRGLSAVEYAYTVEKVEAPTEARASLSLAVGAAGAGGVAPSLPFLALLRPTVGPAPVEDAGRQAQGVPLTTFDKLRREQAAKALTRARLEELLTRPPEANLLKSFDLDPELEVFNVGRLSLAAGDDKSLPQSHRLRLWVAATDNNVETGPGVGQSKEKFTFLVVSENELLAEIAKEEEGLHVKLEEAVNRLKDGKIKLDKIAQELADLKPDEFSPLARRTEEVQEAASRSGDTAREVLTDYTRILKELRANQVQTGMINKVSDKICEPLDAALNVDFVQTDDALRELLRTLEAKTADPRAAGAARERLQALIDRLNGVLENMGDITTLNKLITALVQIEKREREEYDRLKELLREKEKKLLDVLDDVSKPKDKP
jgi:hypothetical protein